MPLRIENLDALHRASDRIASLKSGSRQVINRAKTKLRRSLPPQAKRYILARFNLQSSYVVKRLKCFFDTNSVSLVANGVRTYLSNFNPRQDAQGIVVQIEIGDTISLPHAFMRSPGGFSGSRHYKTGTALVRAIVAGQCVAAGAGFITAQPLDNFSGAKVDGHGYPIAALLGPSVGEMLATGDIEDRLADFGAQTWNAEVDRLVELAHGN